MPDPLVFEVHPPTPGRVRTRQDFASELTLLREQAGLTVRQVAGKVGVQGAHSTIGDWFAGRGLPSTASTELLVRVLEVCGVSDTRLVEQWLQAWWRVRRTPGRRAGGPEPYRGLNSFQLDDAEWFFGRQALTGQLIARLADLHAAGGGMQVVVGASGSGKSSLLRAGMIAALHEGRVPGSAGWPVLLFTPGSRPVEELAARLAALTGIPAGEMAEAMRADPARCAGYARQAAAAAGPDAGGAPSVVEIAAGGVAGRAGERQLVLVIDQFEEVFTACADDEEQRLFIAALCAAASGPRGALVVVGLRADFYAPALRYPQLVAAVQAGQLAVGPMSRAELREAIVEPAGKARIDIEDGLVELLLREVSPRGGGRTGVGAHEAGVLPLLSHALYATWCQGQGRRLTIADYRDVGGIDGAVAASAGKVYDELTGHQRELARRLFLCLVHIAPDTADTRRRVTTVELLSDYGDAQAAEMEGVLDRFVAQRLITADVDTVEISHEALLTAWPQLRVWLDTDRDGLVIGRRLAEAAATWRREQHTPAALYRGTRLAAAQGWAETAGPYADLTPLARDFLAASIQYDRRRARRLRQLIAGLSVLLLLSVTATVIAINSQRATREQRNIAVSRKVAGEATALRVTNPALAAQLSLAAYRLAPTVEARGSLLSTFGSPYATRLTGHTDYVNTAEFSPDGRTLATASVDRTVRLWDVADPHHPGEPAVLTGHKDSVDGVAFSPDGRTLATASGDRTVRLWDVSDPRHPGELATLTGHTDGVHTVAFSPDGRTLATGSTNLATVSGDRTVRLWDVSDPRHPGELATLTGHTNYVAGVAFSPDGRTLATVSGDRTVRLWDVSDPRHPGELATLTGHKDLIYATKFDPDGYTLATASADRTVRLWDVTNRRHPTSLATLTSHKDLVYTAEFSPDGYTLATASADNTARLWDITDPRRPRALITLISHVGGSIDTNAIVSAAFSPDGRTLATASLDHTARLWDIPGPVLAGHTGIVRPAAFSRDGNTLAIGSVDYSAERQDHTARLWDVTDPYHPTALAALTGYPDRILPAFSPDGHTMATGSGDHMVRLWDVTDPRRPRTLATLTSSYSDEVRFSPDGHSLAGTSSRKQAVRLWDVTDPRRPRTLATLTGHTKPVNGVAFGPDGRTLATTSYDRTARLWDVTDPRHPRTLATLTGHSDAVYSVAFGPDGRTLATTSHDNTARLWDVTDPRHPRTLATLTGHANFVVDVAFSSDGRTLATTSADHTVRLWDVAEPHRPIALAILTGHTDSVSAVAFGPDGRTLATGSDDRTARLWEIDTDRVAARICDLVHPTITRSEWNQYFPDLDYQPPCR